MAAYQQVHYYVISCQAVKRTGSTATLIWYRERLCLYSKMTRQIVSCVEYVETSVSCLAT